MTRIFVNRGNAFLEHEIKIRRRDGVHAAFADQVNGGSFHFVQQSAAAQGRTQRQIEDAGADHRHHGVDQGGDCADLCPCVGDLLRDTQHIHLIEVAHQGICHHIERHAGGGGDDYGGGQVLLFVVCVQLEDPVGHKTHDQTDAQLQKEGLGGRSDVPGGEIGDGHAHGASHTAPEAPQKQRRQHAEHIAQMECGLFRAYGDIDFEEGKAHIAQRCKHGGKGQRPGGGGCAPAAAEQGEQHHGCSQQDQDQFQSVLQLVTGGRGFGDGGGSCAGELENPQSQQNHSGGTDKPFDIGSFHKIDLLFT